MLLVHFSTTYTGQQAGGKGCLTLPLPPKTPGAGGESPVKTGIVAVSPCHWAFLLGHSSPRGEKHELRGENDCLKLRGCSGWDVQAVVAAGRARPTLEPVRTDPATLVDTEGPQADLTECPGHCQTASRRNYWGKSVILKNAKIFKKC